MNLLQASKALLTAMGGGHTTSQFLKATVDLREAVAEVEARTKLRKAESWSAVEKGVRAQAPEALVDWILLREEFAWSARERERCKDENGACLMWAAAERVAEIIREKTHGG